MCTWQKARKPCGIPGTISRATWYKYFGDGTAHSQLSPQDLSASLIEHRGELDVFVEAGVEVRSYYGGAREFCQHLSLELVINVLVPQKH